MNEIGTFAIVATLCISAFTIGFILGWAVRAERGDD